MLEVLRNAAVDGGRRAARDGELVLRNGVADLRASGPYFGICAGRIGCIRIVPEAIARHVDLLRRAAVAVRIDDILVVAVLLVLDRTLARVVVEGHVARAVHEGQKMPRRIARDESVQIVQRHLVPVDMRGGAVRERQQRISCCDVRGDVEVHFLELIDIRRRHGVINVEHIARDRRLIAAVNIADGRSRRDRRTCRTGGRICRAEAHCIARRRTRRRMAAVDIVERTARDGDRAPRRCTCAGVLRAVDRAADRACGDVDDVLRRLARCVRLGERRAMDVARDSAARDRDRVARRLTDRACGGERCTVDIACRRAGADRHGVFLGAALLRAHIRTVAVLDRAARELQRVLRRAARRQELSRRDIALRVLDKSAVGRRRERAARDGERIALDLIADLRAPRPCLGVRAVRRRVCRCCVALELVAFHADARRTRAEAVIRIDDVFELLRHGGFRPAAQRIGVVRALLEADAGCVLHELHPVRLIRLDAGARQAVRIDFELPPVKTARHRAARQIQHGIRRVDGAVEVEDELLEILDVPDVRIGIDVQRVARDVVRVRAARDRARDRAGERPRLIAEVHGVARGLARPLRIARIDIAADGRRSHEGDRVARRIAGRARACECAAVDAARDSAARELDLIARRVLRRAGGRDRAAVEAARNGAARNFSRVGLRRAVLRRDLCAVAVRHRAARDGQRVLLGIARGERLSARRELVVLDKTAVGCRRQRAALYLERVALDLVADGGASRPCLRVRSICRRIRRLIVLELVAVDVDIARRVDAMVVRVDDILVFAAARALLRAERGICVVAVLHEADAGGILHEGEETLLVGLRREGVVRRGHVDARPVKACGRAARELEKRVGGVHGAVELEADLREVLDIADGSVRVDVQRVVRRSGLVAARERPRDARAARHGICAVAEVDGVARRLARAGRIACIDVLHRAARDRDRVARRIARTGMGNKAAVDRAADACRRGDAAARDIDLVARGAAAITRRKAAVDVAHRAAREVHRVARAVVFQRLRRARARRPAAVGVAVGRAVHGERVARRRVADDGASRPDILRRTARVQRRSRTLECVAAEDDLRRRRRRVVRVDCRFARVAAARKLLRARIVRDVDVRRVLHEDETSRRRRTAVVGELLPVEVGRRAARECQHGVRSVRRAAVVVEVHLVEVLDVPHGGIAVDVQDIVRGRRPAAAVDRARDARRAGGERDLARRRAVAEVHRVARGRARAGREAAVDIAADRRIARDGDAVARRLTRRARRRDRAAVDAARDRACRENRLVVRRVSVLRPHLCAVGVARARPRDRGSRICPVLLEDERISVGIACRQGLSRRLVALCILDETAVGILKRPTRDGERVLFDLVAGGGASCPCGILRSVRRLELRRRIVLEPEAVHIDVLRCIDRVVVRVDDVLKVAVRALLRADRIVCIRRPLHEADACRILHEGKETLLVGLRREGKVLRRDLDARPVKTARRAARDLEQRVAGRAI